MSPRAAWRLERLGFEAFDYVAGKVDWIAAGMPSVRADPAQRRALDAADRSPRTCRPEAVVATVELPVLVVNESGILLGRVEPGSYGAGATAEDVMQSGPATVRAHEPLDPLLARMEHRRVDEIAVTTPEGRLLGSVRRS